MVIGDVHGCVEELRALLDMVRYRQGTDRVILAGDLFDKGPDAAGAVRFAMSIGAQCVLGNHDEKHVRWRRHEDRRAKDPTYVNPVRSLSEQDQEANRSLNSWEMMWVAQRPPYALVAPNWVVVHAGFEAKIQLIDQVVDHMIRIRWVHPDGKMAPPAPGTLNQPPNTRKWMEAYDGQFNVVYGHAIHSLEEPRIDHAKNGRKTVGIDTGCAYGGRLTCFIVEENRFVQVDARREYYPKSKLLIE